jgi:hypothetical protein
VRSDIGAGGNRRVDHFRAIFWQLNGRLNLLNVVEQGVLQKSLRSQAVERKVLASQLVPNEILEVMNNSTKGRRVEEHDKAQK